MTHGFFQLLFCTKPPKVIIQNNYDRKEDALILKFNSFATLSRSQRLVFVYISTISRC